MVNERCCVERPALVLRAHRCRGQTAPRTVFHFSPPPLRGPLPLHLRWTVHVHGLPTHLTPALAHHHTYHGACRRGRSHLGSHHTTTTHLRFTPSARLTTPHHTTTYHTTHHRYTRLFCTTRTHTAPLHRPRFYLPTRLRSTTYLRPGRLLPACPPHLHYAPHLGLPPPTTPAPFPAHRRTGRYYRTSARLVCWMDERYRCYRFYATTPDIPATLHATHRRGRLPARSALLPTWLRRTLPPCAPPPASCTLTTLLLLPRNTTALRFCHVGRYLHRLPPYHTRTTHCHHPPHGTVGTRHHFHHLHSPRMNTLRSCCRCCVVATASPSRTMRVCAYGC